jgi:hypothetical protein
VLREVAYGSAFVLGPLGIFSSVFSSALRSLKNECKKSSDERQETDCKSRSEKIHDDTLKVLPIQEQTREPGQHTKEHAAPATDKN